MKPQDIDTIVRLLREEASEISSKDYARIMMREAATTIVALASELAARDEQARTARADAEHRQARLEIALRDMGAASTDAADQWTSMAISMQRLLTATAAAAKAMAAAKAALATHKAAPVQSETQPECPVHPRDRPVVPEALDAATRAERDRVLALVRQMLRCSRELPPGMSRIDAMIADIESGATCT